MGQFSGQGTTTRKFIGISEPIHKPCNLHTAHYTLHPTIFPLHCTLQTEITHYSLQTSHCKQYYTVITTLWTFPSAPCTLHSAHCPLYSALCTLHFVHCTLHSSHCTLHTALCTLHSALCTLHSVFKVSSQRTEPRAGGANGRIGEDLSSGHPEGAARGAAAQVVISGLALGGDLYPSSGCIVS